MPLPLSREAGAFMHVCPEWGGDMGISHIWRTTPRLQSLVVHNILPRIRDKPKHATKEREILFDLMGRMCYS